MDIFGHSFMYLDSKVPYIQLTVLQLNINELFSTLL